MHVLFKETDMAYYLQIKFSEHKNICQKKK